MQTKRSVTTTQIKKIIESQNYRCALTNRPLTPETASLDHKQPISRGGTHEVANLWVVDTLSTLPREASPSRNSCRLPRCRESPRRNHHPNRVSTQPKPPLRGRADASDAPHELLGTPDPVPQHRAVGTAARLVTVCLFCPTPSSLAKGLHYDHHFPAD